MKSLRIEIPWINSLKFLCIILIYLYHAEFYCGITESYIQFLYLPFFTNSFFFVSGYLLIKKQLSQPLISYDRTTWYNAVGGGKSLIGNILFKIAIPSIVFSTLIYFPKRILRGDGIDAMSMLHDTVLGGAMWFTCALTVTELIAFIVLFARARNILWYVIVGVVSVLLANYITSTGFQVFESNKIPWQYKSGLIAFFFFACGGLYWKFEPVIYRYIRNYTRFYLVILLSAFWVGITGLLLFYGKLDLLRLLNQQLTRGAINMPSIFWAIWTILIIVNICKLWDGNSFTNWVGRHSIAFYFFCGAIPNFLSIICLKMIPQVEYGQMVLIVWALSLVLALSVVYLFFRYIPWVFDFRKLTRK